MTPKANTPIDKKSDHPMFGAMAAFLRSYMTFPDPAFADVLALWAIGTWVYPRFDAYPYLVITSATKRSGKTRLAELLAMISNNGKPFAAMTAATMFRLIDENKESGITVFFDEAEELSSESATTMRSVLNVGYRRGQAIPRVTGDGVKEFVVYCPKVFVLIGDVHDTLHDRSIIVELIRATPPEIFMFDTATARAQTLLGEHTADMLNIETAGIDVHASIQDALTFLDGRDAEIWSPILAIARAICPSHVHVIRRMAADLCASKTADRRRYTELAKAEDTARDDAYSERAIKDIAFVFHRRDARLTTEACIERMKAIDTSPWRTYRGEGLTPVLLAHLLSPFGLTPRYVKISGKSARGYQRSDVLKAFAKIKE